MQVKLRMLQLILHALIMTSLIFACSESDKENKKSSPNAQDNTSDNKRPANQDADPNDGINANPEDGATSSTTTTLAPEESPPPEACPGPEDPAVEADQAKLFFEFNYTDDDLGVQGIFGIPGWKSLCLYDPQGNKIMEFIPKYQLEELAMDTVFFESREPLLADFPWDWYAENFPEGLYEIRGYTYNDGAFGSSATFSHTIPGAPNILTPVSESIVPVADLSVTWESVTVSTNGDPLDITGYEVIVTKELEDADSDPNGFSDPLLSVHLGPNATSFTVPADFLGPGYTYELEVLALEASGNQTISVIFFDTEAAVTP